MGISQHNINIEVILAWKCPPLPRSVRKWEVERRIKIAVISTGSVVSSLVQKRRASFEILFAKCSETMLADCCCPFGFTFNWCKSRLNVFVEIVATNQKRCRRCVKRSDVSSSNGKTASATNCVVSSSAVFWNVTQRSPNETAEETIEHRGSLFESPRSFMQTPLTFAFQWTSQEKTGNEPSHVTLRVLEEFHSDKIHWDSFDFGPFFESLVRPLGTNLPMIPSLSHYIRHFAILMLRLAW